MTEQQSRPSRRTLAAAIGLAVVVILVTATVSYYQLVLAPIAQTPLQTETTAPASPGSEISEETSAAAGSAEGKNSFPITVLDTKTPWAFIYDGKNNPDLLVSEGATVEITFRNDGVTVHDFTIIEFEVEKGRTQVDPGREATITFEANKKGEFTYFCSQPGHKELGMVGKFIVK